MPFESRVFKLPKDVDFPEQDQDACRIDGLRGIAAIADGVASGIFSRLWAGILTDAILSDTPDPTDKPAFSRWLTLRRELWASQIDVTRLSWFQKPKLREGAFSTLLWVHLLDDPQGPQPGGYRLRALAVGDSCLFHVQQGRVLYSFPIQRSAELEANPVVVGSVDLNRDQLLEFRSLDEPCRSGDLVVLCTDAVADWALRLAESGQAPAWEDYWSMSPEAWRDEVMGLRNQRQMRFDDATLALLRITDPVAAVEPPCDAEVVVEPGSASPPPLPSPGDASEDLWNEKLRSLSDQVAGGVKQGLQKLKGLSESAGSAFRKYRDKFRQGDKE